MSDSPIQHVLLDIEGTTCPVSFVNQTLFPYANEQLGPFLAVHGCTPTIAELVRQVEEAWAHDPSPEAVALRSEASHHIDPALGVLSYLRYLIRDDRKLAALKELQGLVWEEGYRSGHLLGPLYEDVPPALERWQRAGLTLSVYSSGSVRAQQLLYGYSNSGDLRSRFSHWFDTRTGPKHEATSYLRICQTLQSPPSQVLFISDSHTELEAAASAALVVLHSHRLDPVSTQTDSTIQTALAQATPASLYAYPSVSSFEFVNPQAHSNQGGPFSPPCQTQ
jgi:enolase-phosphatase E1